MLFRSYPHTILGWQGPPTRPAHIWALAFREGWPALTPAQYDDYRALLRRYARQPLSWRRGLRYRLGRWLCGRGPFAPYLDQERWETECRTPAVA